MTETDFTLREAVIGDDLILRYADEPFHVFYDRLVAAAAELIKSDQWNEHYRDFKWRHRPLTNIEMKAMSDALDNDVVLAMRGFLASFDTFLEKELIIHGNDTTDPN